MSTDPVDVEHYSDFFEGVNDTVQDITRHLNKMKAAIAAGTDQFDKTFSIAKQMNILAQETRNTEHRRSAVIWKINEYRAKEAMWAKEAGLPVIELPSLMPNRCLSVDDTREVLRLVGAR
jgi:hypothetical protein